MARWDGPPVFSENIGNVKQNQNKIAQTVVVLGCRGSRGGELTAQVISLKVGEDSGLLEIQWLGT